MGRVYSALYDDIKSAYHPSRVKLMGEALKKQGIDDYDKSYDVFTLSVRAGL